MKFKFFLSHYFFTMKKLKRVFWLLLSHIMRNGFLTFSEHLIISKSSILSIIHLQLSMHLKEDYLISALALIRVKTVYILFQTYYHVYYIILYSLLEIVKYVLFLIYIKYIEFYRPVDSVYEIISEERTFFIKM